MKKKVLAISGSLRSHASNNKILKAIEAAYANEIQFHLYQELGALPYFNPDLVQNATAVPDCVRRLYKLIEGADGVLICTPEYVFSLPGVLKNALEWTVSTTVFSFKPFAFIIASASGEKAFESMELIMETLLQKPVDHHCKLLIKGAKGIVTEQGMITDSKTSAAVALLMEHFIAKM